MRSRSCQLSSTWLLHSHEMLISWSAEEKEAKGKGRSKGKQWQGKKMQRAELTLTKTSHFQSSIPTSMCGCVPVLSCSHLAQSSLMSSWRLEVHVEFDFGVSLRFCSWESCQEQQGSRLCLSQVVP